jgi:hypothetical protein
MDFGVSTQSNNETDGRGGRGKGEGRRGKEVGGRGKRMGRRGKMGRVANLPPHLANLNSG